MIHKTTRSILSVLLAVLLLVTSTPLTPAFAGEEGAVSLQSESGESEGLKQVDGVYQIGSAEQLAKFRDKVNKGETDADAVLTADIDLNPDMKIDEDGTVTNGNKLVQWTPIGNSISGDPYEGTFNGNGHTISGLYIKNTSSDTDYQGLFGYVSGTVQNLSVSGSVSGNRYVGGVVGVNRGSVENCYNTGSVSGNRYVGGVVGDNRGTVKNCYNIGEVSGNRDVGGVVGWNISSVTNCYNTGSVSGPDSGSDNNVGGVVGYNSGNVTNSYNTGAVSGNSYVGGVVGLNHGGVENCYFLQQNGVPEQGIGGGDEEAEGAAAVNDLTDQDQFEGWDFIDTWRISKSLGFPVLQDNAQDGLPPGLGTKASPYEISTADELKNFATAVNGGIEKSAHAKLMNNIDLSSVCSKEKGNWTPIGTSSKPYSGNFDGNNYTISGLYIDSRANDQGLFGYVGSSGKVQNLSVSGSVTSSVSGGEDVGGIVGYNNGGTVTNCAFSGSVSGKIGVGGVVGDNEGRVENCHNAGEVSGNDYVGGVVGDNSGTVENCYNTGNISGNAVGGVVGWNASGANVENCYNTGTVTGTDSGDRNQVGGVVGYNRSGGSVTNSYNTGKVTGPDSGTGNRVGGVVGYNDGGSVTNCYNIGTVTGTDDYVGGVVGYNDVGGSVTNCYFLQGTADSDIGKNEGSDTATEKDDTAFHSGEVAWRLQDGQTAGSGQVWGQTLGGEEDSLPTLVALNPGAAQPVYKVTFKYGYEDAPADEISYTNGSVKFPDFERTGHTLTGWQDEDGQAVTEPITVTADTTFTAQWTKDTVNYTVSVSADPEAGGTVTTSAESAAEGTQVTVTATANDGYTFVAWQEGGTKIENAGTSYTFTVNDNCTLTAIFEKDPEPTPTPTPDPTPAGPSTGDSTGWDDILDELENAENGDQITIDMGDETKVPAEIFESLAGKDVDVTFDLGDDLSWTVNGKDIPDDAALADLDLGVALDTDGIPANVVNAITGEVGTVQITLAHNGEFGFTMTLTAPLGKENAGYWANLYHYDEDAEALNFEAAVKIDEDGSVTIPFTHASQYAIVIDTHSHATVDVSDIFVDVAPNAWYKDAVQYAYDQGLMTGVSDTEFAPEATTTRAMIVSILARLENVTTAEAAGFADVDDNDWYATAVNWAANVGVVNGYEDNTFKPNTAITREQLAAILMNYATYKGYDVSARADLSHYSDADSISSWANDVLLWAVAEGLLTGVTDDTIAPQAHATRAQVAAILQRFLSE